MRIISNSRCKISKVILASISLIALLLTSKSSRATELESLIIQQLPEIHQLVRERQLREANNKITSILADRKLTIERRNAAAHILAGRIAVLEDRFSDAAQSYSNSLAILRENNELRASVLEQFIFAQKIIGNTDAALSAAMEAIRITENASETDSRSLAKRMHLASQILIDMSRFAEAESTLRRGLLILMNRQPQEESLVADLRQDLSRVLARRGNTFESVELQELASSIYRKIYGVESKEYLISLQNLGERYHEAGNRQKSKEAREYVIELSPKVFGYQNNFTLSAISSYTQSLKLDGDLKRAFELQGKIVKRAEIANPNSMFLAISLNNLAITAFELGNFEDAAALEMRSLNLKRRLVGSNHMSTANTLHGVGMSIANSGAAEAARPYFNESLQIINNLHGAKHHRLASPLTGLALVEMMLGNYDESIRLSLSAIRLRSDSLGAGHPETLESLISHSMILLASGASNEAISLITPLHTEIQRSLGSKNLAISGFSESLAAAYTQLEDFQQALRYTNQAIDALQEHLNPLHPRVGAQKYNRGLLKLSLGLIKEAENDFIDALSISRRTHGDFHLNTLLIEQGLLSLKIRSGNSEGLTKQYDSLLSKIDSALGKAHPVTIRIMADAAIAKSRLGVNSEAQKIIQDIESRTPNVATHWSKEAMAFHLAKAVITSSNQDLSFSLQHQFRAFEIAAATLGDKHSFVGDRLSDIGVIRSSERRLEESIFFLKQAVNVYQSARLRAQQAGTKELASYTSKVTPTYQLLASSLVDAGRLEEASYVLNLLKDDEQFNFIRRSAGANLRRARVGYTPTEQRWMSRYSEISSRLAALGKEEQALVRQAKFGLSEEQKKRQVALAADLKVAQAAFESFLSEMRSEFSNKGQARSVELAESSVKALSELRDLLKGLGDGVGLLQVYLTDENVNFLLTTPGVQLARQSKIKTQDLNRQVAEFRRLLRDPKSDPRTAAQALYQLLMAPVAQDLEQAGLSTVMLSLDGVLRYVPFGALHDGQRYLVQRWNLPIYTSVVRDRLRDSANSNWQAAGLGITRKLGEFDPLPAVRTELNSIIRTGSSGILPGEVHLDEDFTAQRLKEVTQRKFPVVHVASHFRFSPGTEANSFLLLGDGSQLTLGDLRTQNYRFDDVDLLTLSACDTGLGGGRDAQGREIEGFGVIAQQQGAKAVLATLWPVADQSTAILMADMYRRRQQSQTTKIDALRQAQVSLASNPRTSHPFFWAPFILMGNWR